MVLMLPGIFVCSSFEKTEAIVLCKERQQQFGESKKD